MKLWDGRVWTADDALAVSSILSLSVCNRPPPAGLPAPTPFPGGTREVRDGHGGIRHTTAVAAGTMRGVSGEARADGGEAAAAICVPVPGPSLRSAGSP